jgi:hypothetical protein
LIACSVAENEAVTEVAELKVTVQLAVPKHAPDQPAKLDPGAGLAVSVTVVPGAKLALQLAQLMPEGLLLIVPLPEPAADTLNATPADVKLAATDTVLFNTRLQLFDDPEQAPDHPLNEFPEFGVAVRVTIVPLLKLAVHVCPQLMPEGVLVTVPPDVGDTLNCRL